MSNSSPAHIVSQFLEKVRSAVNDVHAGVDLQQVCSFGVEVNDNMEYIQYL